MQTIKPCPECGGILRVALLTTDSYDMGVECGECIFHDDTTHGYLDEEEPVLIEVCS